MAETVVAPLKSRDVLREGKDLVEDIESKSSELLEFLEDFQRVYKEDNLEEAIFAKAFNFTYDLVNNNAFNILMNEAYKAIISSVEFNHPLFINHFMKSMELANSRESLVSIIIDEGNRTVTGVEINMSGVGNIEEYGAAIEAARTALGIGKIDPSAPGRGKTHKTGAEVRSDIWREKIYGVAREGIRVFRRYVGKKRKNPVIKYKDRPDRPVYIDDDDEATSGKLVDITGRYRGKYEKTIEARLSALGTNASYWHLIDKGNSGVEFSSDIGGTRYPSVPASNFVNATKRSISDAVKNAFEIYKKDAEEILSGLIAKDYGLEEWSPSTKALPRAVKERIRQELSPERVKETLLEHGNSGEEVIRTDKGVAKFKLTATGKGMTQSRNTKGQYARTEYVLGE